MKKTVVNGYNDPKTQVNGMGCAAAMLIAGLKKECGNVYIYPATASGYGEEYVYILSTDNGRVFLNGQLFLEVQSVGNGVLYSGPLNEFDGESLESTDN